MAKVKLAISKSEYFFIVYTLIAIFPGFLFFIHNSQNITEYHKIASIHVYVLTVSPHLCLWNGESFVNGQNDADAIYSGNLVEYVAKQRQIKYQIYMAMREKSERRKGSGFSFAVYEYTYTVSEKMVRRDKFWKFYILYIQRKINEQEGPGCT